MNELEKGLMLNPYRSALEEIEACMAKINGPLTAKGEWDIFSRDILPRVACLPPAGLEIIAPRIQKILKVSPTALKKEIKDFQKLIEPGEKEETFSTVSRRTQSLRDGRLCYRTNRGWVTAGQPGIEEEKSTCPLYHFSTRGHIRLLDIHEGKESYPKMAEVYDQVVNILSRYVIWKNPHQAKVVGLWIIGTYFASIFQWYGYLWITSPARRCGKSLLLEMLSSLAFNATPVLVNPRPAYLYRTVDRDFPTVIIDELSRFKGDDGDDYSEVLALLNAGAKNGLMVSRMEKVKDSFEARYYHAYCPKALAGLTSLPDTLDDRTLRIDMTRKKKSEKTERLNLRKCGEELTRLRDDLYLVGLGYDKEVTEFYDEAEELDIPQELDDRLKDVLEPLFALASIIDTERGNLNVTSSLKAYALELAGARGVDDHADLAQHIVRALLKLNLSPDDTKILTGKEALELFRQEPELDWCDTPKKAGRLLNRLGFNSYPHRVGMKQVKGYKLRYQDLQDLKERYVGETENSL